MDVELSLWQGEEGARNQITETEFRAFVAPSRPPRKFWQDAEFLARYQTIVAVRVARPEFDSLTERVEPAAQPVFNDGEYQWGWQTRSLTEDEVALANRQFRDAVNAERDRRIAMGVRVTVLGVSETIHVRGAPEHQRFFDMLAMRCQREIARGNGSWELTYRDAADLHHALTANQFMTLYERTSDWVTAVVAASWAIKTLSRMSPALVAARAEWPADELT